MCHYEGSSVNLNPTFPEAITVSGVTGGMARKLNGIYERQMEEYGGHHVFKKTAEMGKAKKTNVVLW